MRCNYGRVTGNRGLGVLERDGGKTHAAPVPKGSPVNIPEPVGWTECHPVRSLVDLGPGQLGLGLVGGRTVGGTHKAVTLNRPLGS